MGKWCLELRQSHRISAIGGREFTELGYGGGDEFEGGGDFGFGGVAAKAEADAGARFRGWKADGGEDV
jgi:hypothetical protein